MGIATSKISGYISTMSQGFKQKAASEGSTVPIQPQILKRGESEKNECLGRLKEFLPDICLEGFLLLVKK